MIKLMPKIVIFPVGKIAMYAFNAMPYVRNYKEKKLNTILIVPYGKVLSKYKYDIANESLLNIVLRSLQQNNIKYFRSTIVEFFIAFLYKIKVINIKKKKHQKKIDCESDGYYSNLEFISMMPQYANDVKALNPKKPFCSLLDNEIEKGKNIFLKNSIDTTKKFVAFHVRDDAFHPEQDLDYRNGSISNMIPALNTIEENGFLSFRMGKIQEEINLDDYPENVVDYANSFHSDFMDAYLISQCEFFIGSTSGLFAIPFLFNKPQLSINMIPLHDTGLGVNDIYIPKMLWSINEKRLLSFSEMLEIPRSDLLNGEFYRNNNIEPIENTSDEIENGVQEMIKSLKGSIYYDDEYTHFSNKLKNYFPECSFGFYSDAKISPYFLKKYSELI
jgi:putative glycosyltransferase (TIGR04372 family)